MNHYTFSKMKHAMRPLILLLAISSATLTAWPAYAQQPADKFNYSRSTDFTYYPNGQLQSQTVEKDQPGLCSTTTFTYDGYGNTTEQVTTNCPGASARAAFTQRKATKAYDAQPVSSCPVPAPSSPITLQPGAFPTLGKNALGHQEVMTFDARFGTAKSATGPNCLTTSWEVDDFGRTVREKRADGTSTVTAYCYVAGTLGIDTTSNSPSCTAPANEEIPAGAVAYVQTEPRDRNDNKNGARTRGYADAAGRTIRTVTEAFDGGSQQGGAYRLIVQDTEYNPQGMATLTTQPYFLDTKASVAANSANSYGMTATVYDVLGRPSTVYVTDPKGSRSGIAFGARAIRQASITQFAYDKLATTTTNDQNRTRTEERNIDGQVVRVTDAAGAQIAYQYDAFGNLVKTRDALQNVIAIDFDIRGRKTTLNDPDIGIQKYDYNALGELVWQESPNQRAKGQSTSFVIDALGRVTSRVEPEFTSTWTYDRYADASTCVAGLGKLCETSSTNGVSEKTYFDAYGRPKQSRRKITNGPTFTTGVTYDTDNGRVDTMTYPSGLRVSYGYTPRLGFLETVKGGAVTYWRALSMNAWGNLEQKSAGNGVQTTAVFDPETGRTMDLAAGPGGAVFRHVYTYDSLSNMKSRNDTNGAGNGRGVTENYVYDNVNRLEQYSIDGPDMPYPMTRTVDVRYNALGSISYKSDVGTYTYPAPGSKSPHAVASISGPVTNSYLYDANGNMTNATAGKYRRIAYTSFDLPDGEVGIEGSNGTRYTWQYDASHARIKEVRSNSQGTRTTWNFHPDNMGGLAFEQEVASNGAITNRHYIVGGAGTVGMITTNGAISNPDDPQATDTPPAGAKVEYWHADQLGSISAITDAAGTVTQRMAYDPFGKRRNTNGSYDAAGNIVIDNAEGTDRGFTGHEQMDDIGIVHMNGRIYDANIGRVMQGDPLIQAPDELQNFDRYSYVMNNPLNLVDPSGFSFWTNLRDGIKKGLKSIWNKITNGGVSIQYNSNGGVSVGNAPKNGTNNNLGTPSCPYGNSGGGNPVIYSCSTGAPSTGAGSNGSGFSLAFTPGSGTSSTNRPPAPTTPAPAPQTPSAPAATSEPTIGQRTSDFFGQAMRSFGVFDIFVPSRESFMSGAQQLLGGPCDYNCAGHDAMVRSTADVMQGAAQGVAEAGNRYYPELAKTAALSAVPVGSVAQEFTTLYRAVSRAELASVANLGKFTPGPGAMGNKWFAESAADAAAWGKKFFFFDKEAVFTLRIRVPNDLAGKMMRNPKLDGIGPARSADAELLEQINRRGHIDALNGSVLK